MISPVSVSEEINPGTTVNLPVYESKVWWISFVVAALFSVCFPNFVFVLIKLRESKWRAPLIMRLIITEERRSP